MNLDLTTEQALQIRAALRAAQIVSEGEYHANKLILRHYPTRTQCEDLVDLLDAAAQRYEAALNAFHTSLFDYTE